MSKRYRTALSGIALSTVLMGCAALPALTQLAIAFGQDLIAAAAVNHTPRYATQVEALLIALADQSGLRLQPTLLASGYQPPPLQHDRPSNGGQPDYQAEESAPTSPYQESDVYGEDPSPYPDEYGYDDTLGNTEDQYDTDAEPYSDEYTDDISARSVKAIQVELALLAQRAGTRTLEIIEDGDQLRDGGTNPAAGDLLRFHAQVNCNCFLYVIGVDATGYVAQIFPDAEEGLTNPVQADSAIKIPGPDNWWALDQHKGVEQVYVVVSRTPRTDVEQVLSELAGIRKTVDPGNYQPVTQAAIVPPTRGLVKIQTDTTIPHIASDSSRVFTPALFSTEQPTNGLVLTRWFYHR